MADWTELVKRPTKSFRLVSLKLPHLKFDWCIFTHEISTPDQSLSENGEKLCKRITVFGNSFT